MKMPFNQRHSPVRVKARRPRSSRTEEAPSPQKKSVDNLQENTNNAKSRRINKVSEQANKERPPPPPPPPVELLVSTYDALGKRRLGCNCSKTGCLRRYCQCFANGLMCDPDVCGCQNCSNIQGREREREDAMNAIIRRTGVVVKTLKEKAATGCNCKRGCSKGYCVCLKAGRQCVPGVCKCQSCANGIPEPSTSGVRVVPQESDPSSPKQTSQDDQEAARTLENFSSPPRSVPEPTKNGLPPSLATPYRTRAATNSQLTTPTPLNSSLSTNTLNSLKLKPLSAEEANLRPQSVKLECRESLPIWL